MMQPSDAIKKLKRKINIYHYCDKGMKQTIKAIEDGEFDSGAEPLIPEAFETAVSIPASDAAALNLPVPDPVGESIAKATSNPIKPLGSSKG